MANTSVGLK